MFSQWKLDHYQVNWLAILTTTKIFNFDKHLKIALQLHMQRPVAKRDLLIVKIWHHAKIIRYEDWSQLASCGEIGLVMLNDSSTSGLPT